MMKINHNTREIEVTLTILAPGSDQICDKLFSMSDELALKFSGTKRVTFAPNYGEKGFSFSQIFIRDREGYELFLHLRLDTNTPFSGMYVTERSDAVLVVRDESLPKFRHLSDETEAKVKTLKLDLELPLVSTTVEELSIKHIENLIQSFDQKMDSIEVEPPKKEIKVELPSEDDFKFRIESEPPFWVEDEFLKLLSSQTVPRDQYFFIEELRGGHPYLVYSLEKKSFYDFVSNTAIEPRTLIALKASGYERLYHVTRGRACSYMQSHFFGLLRASGRAAWIDKIEYEQGGIDADDLLADLLREKLPLPPSIGLGAVLVEEHAMGKFKLDEIHGRLKQVILSGIEELLKPFEGTPKIKKVQDIKLAYDFLKDRVGDLKEIGQLRGFYKLALISHADPTPAVVAFKKLFPKESLLEQAKDGDPLIYHGSLR